MDMATPQFLLPLPTEILVVIASGLDAEGYGALRLSCKSLEERLFPYFAEKFFTSKHFFRNYYSLSVLRDISESRLGPFVKTVVLGTELLPSDLFRWSDNASVDDCLKVFADQRSLCASGWDRDLLFLSFSKLPNLEGVAVQEFEGDCFHDSPLVPARIKAGYGLKGLMEEFGIDNMSAFRQDEFDEEEVGISCVQAVLSSAARAKKPLKAFKIAYHIQGQRAIACDALHIPFFQRLEIPPILSSLEDLHLDVFQKRLTPWPLMTGAGQVYDTVECDTFPLRKFLGYTGQLRRLTLRQLNHKESKDGFWDWMAANPTVVYKGPGDAARLTTPPPAAFSHLQELRLGVMQVPIEPLTDLVRKIAPTLRKLFFRQIMLIHKPEDPDRNSLPGNVWKELFRVLLEVGGNLDDIEIQTSLSRRLRDSQMPPDGEGGPPQRRQALFHQRDLHYEGEAIERGLREELQISDQDEMFRCQSSAEVDPNDSTSLSWDYLDLYSELLVEDGRSLGKFVCDPS